MAKLLVSLRHEQLPSTLHSQPPNPHIAWDTLPVEVVEEPVPWPRSPGHVRRAAVSAFGLSGTNAHVILEEPPEQVPCTDPDSDRPVPFLLSARGPEALRAQAGQLATFLRSEPHRPSDVASALATKRTHHRDRLAFPAAADLEVAALAERLAQFAQGGPPPPNGMVSTVPDAVPRLAVLFTGQGSQRHRMGHDLRRAYPTFQREYDKVAAAFDGRTDLPLTQVLAAEPGSAEAHLLHRTDYTQPALFVLEVALYRLWASFGLRPDVLMGHSIGELVALHVSGALELEDAATLVAARGRLMAELPEGGAMMAIEATEEETLPRIAQATGTIAIAAINGPQALVVSGDEAPVKALGEQFAQLGRRVRKLSVSHAFHSPRMAPMLDAFAVVVGGLTFHPPRIPVVGNLAGEVLTPAELSDPDTWVRHIREGVRFADGMRALTRLHVGTFVEVGPHGVLCGMGPPCVDGGTFVPSLRRDRDEALTYAEALCRIHAAGHWLDWDALFEPQTRPQIPLPTYPFQRKRFRMDAPASQTPTSSANVPPLTDDSAGVEDLLIRALNMIRGPGTAPSQRDVPNVAQSPVPAADPARDLSRLDPEQRRDAVMEKLWSMMATVLGATPDSFDTDRPLSHLGVDSLIAIELQKHIAALGFPVPLVELLAGPSMEELADFLVQGLEISDRPAQEQSSAVDSGWVVIPRPNPRAAIRLFCFPYGGGGPVMFKGWEDRLPDTVELCLIQLPGRGARIREPLLEHMEDVVAGAAAGMEPFLDRPFAMFGHCVGALQAFEVAHRLRQTTSKSPIHLFASGAAAPTDHHPQFATEQALEISPDGTTRLYELGPELRLQMLEEIGYPGGEAMENPELRAVFMEVLRADATVDGTYVFEGHPPLDVPITSVGGRIDPAVRYDSLRAWGQQTTASHRAMTTRGDHYFIHREDHPWWDLFEQVFSDALDLAGS